MPDEYRYVLAAVERGLNSLAGRQDVRRATEQDQEAAAAYLMTRRRDHPPRADQRARSPARPSRRTDALAQYVRSRARGPDRPQDATRASRRAAVHERDSRVHRRIRCELVGSKRSRHPEAGRGEDDGRLRAGTPGCNRQREVDAQPQGQEGSLRGHRAADGHHVVPVLGGERGDRRTRATQRTAGNAASPHTRRGRPHADHRTGRQKPPELREVQRTTDERQAVRTSRARALEAKASRQNNLIIMLSLGA